MYLSKISIPFKKSELISNSYSVRRKFLNLFTDVLSESQVTALSAIFYQFKS